MASRTYTGTLFYPTNLKEATIRLYTDFDSDEDRKKTEVTGLISWTIVEGGEEADKIRDLTGLYDERDEYLVLKYENGKVEIYPNSKVTMFIL
jgi:hypothetical protein